MKYTATILALGAAASSCHGAYLTEEFPTHPYHMTESYGEECPEAEKVDLISECHEAALAMNIPFEGLRMRNSISDWMHRALSIEYGYDVVGGVRLANDDKDLFTWKADHRPNGCYVKEKRSGELKMLFNLSPTGDKYASEHKNSKAVCSSIPMKTRFQDRIDNPMPMRTAFGKDDEFFTPEQWHANCPVNHKIYDDEEMCRKAAKARGLEYKDFKKVPLREKGLIAKKWFPLGCFESHEDEPYVSMNKEWGRWDIRDYRPFRGLCLSKENKLKGEYARLRDGMANGAIYHNLDDELLDVQLRNDNQRDRKLKTFIKICGGQIGDDGMSITDVSSIRQTVRCQHDLKSFQIALAIVRDLSKLPPIV